MPARRGPHRGDRDAGARRFDQRLRYAGGDGRNHAEIALRQETADLLLAFPPRLAKPARSGSRGDCRPVSGTGDDVRPPLRNAYGPVGIALGADCLYAGNGLRAAAATLPARSHPRCSRRSRWRVVRSPCGSGCAAPPRRASATSCAPWRASGSPCQALAPRPLSCAGGRLGPRPRRPPARPSRPADAEAQKAKNPPPQTPVVERPQTPVAPPVAPPPSAPSVADDQKRYIVTPTPQAPAPVLPEPGSQRTSRKGAVADRAQAGSGSGTGETFFRDLPPEAYRPPN